MYKIDLVMFCWNRAEYTKMTLESLRDVNSGMNFKDINFVVVNHESTDNTIEVIEAFIKDNPGIITRFVTEPNRGVAGGFEHFRQNYCTGAPYIGKIDNDSLFTVNWLSKLYDTITTCDKLGVVGAQEYYDQFFIPDCKEKYFKHTHVGGRFLAKKEIFNCDETLVGTGVKGWTAFQKEIISRDWDIGWNNPPAVIEHVGEHCMEHPRAIINPAYIEYMKQIGRGKNIPKELLNNPIPPIKNPIDLSIVIVSAAKNPDLFAMTQNAVNTALEKSSITKEVIVVESEKVRYLNIAKQISSKGMPFNYNRFLNMGIEKAKGDYIALCNNDLIFRKGWDEILINAMKTYSIESASPYNPVSPPISDEKIIFGLELRKQIYGWCIVVHRDTLYKIGKLDEEFDFWRSDASYAKQLKQKGIKHALIKESVVEHLKSQTLELLDDETKDKFTTEQKEKYIAKYGTLKI